LPENTGEGLQKLIADLPPLRWHRWDMDGEPAIFTIHIGCGCIDGGLIEAALGFFQLLIEDGDFTLR